jgi:signal peptidase II
VRELFNLRINMKKYFIYLLIITVLVTIEQQVKHFITVSINIYQKVVIIQDLFTITYTKNEGAAWGLFQGRMTFLIIITVISLVIFTFVLIKHGDFKNEKLLTISMILLISGSLGNFINRILLSYVIDYLDFLVFGYDFPVFNLADVFLTLGVSGYAISLIFKKEG